jgi:hypothetical protein
MIRTITNRKNSFLGHFIANLKKSDRPSMLETMQNVIKISVPIDVDAEIGYNWADGIEVEKDKTEE